MSVSNERPDVYGDPFVSDHQDFVSVAGAVRSMAEQLVTKVDPTRALGELSLRLRELRPIDQFMQSDGYVSLILGDLEAFRPFDLHKGVAREIADDTFARLYDPKLPTIGLRIDLTPSSALYAMAASQLRAEGDGAANVVLLPPRTYANHYMDSKYLFADRGWMVDEDGVVYGGDFPVLVPINLTDGQEIQSFQRKWVGFSKHTRVIEPKHHAEFLLDKLKGREYTEEIGTVNLATLKYGSESRDQIQTLLADNGNIVVKPSTGNCGTSVLILSESDPNTPYLLDQLDLIYRTNEQLVVEEKIECLPLVDPITGAVLDWNLRVLAVGGEMIGHYARVGKKNTPINISQGAVAMSTEEALAMAASGPVDTEDLIDRLEAEVVKISNNTGAVIIGYDVIITPEGNMRFIEINGFMSGGLANIIKTSVSKDDLAPAKHALKQLVKAASPRARNRMPRNSLRRMPSSINETIAEYIHVCRFADNPKAELEYAYELLEPLSQVRPDLLDVQEFVRQYREIYLEEGLRFPDDPRVFDTGLARYYFERGAYDLGSTILHHVSARQPYNDLHQRRVYSCYPVDAKEILFAEPLETSEQAYAAATKAHQYFTGYLNPSGHGSFASAVVFRTVLADILMKPYEDRDFSMAAMKIALSELNEDDLVLAEPTLFFMELFTEMRKTNSTVPDIQVAATVVDARK